jgi:hypothetical protein
MRPRGLDIQPDAYEPAATMKLALSGTGCVISVTVNLNCSTHVDGGFLGA